MRTASPVGLRPGRRPGRLLGLVAAVVLATAGVAAVASLPSPDGIQGTGHPNAVAGIEGTG